MSEDLSTLELRAFSLYAPAKDQRAGLWEEVFRGSEVRAGLDVRGMVTTSEVNQGGV